MTLKEAAEKWDMSSKTLNDNCTRYKAFIPEEECRKSAGTWLVTREAMIRRYGVPDCDRFFDTHSECEYCSLNEECRDIAETLKPNPSDYEDDEIVL